MGKVMKTPTSSTKRSHPEDYPGPISLPGSNVEDILDSIGKKLSNFDARLSSVKNLLKEFQPFREALGFKQQQVVALTTENEVLSISLSGVLRGKQGP